MSRTYEALKKVERQRGNGPAGFGRAESGSAGYDRAAFRSDVRTAPQPVGNVDDGRGLQYDQLRVWMANQSHNGSGVRVVMVAACRGESGTTTTVAGLAAALSDQPATRVLVVDSNLRTPRLGGVYGCDNTRGFSELLTKPGGDAEALVQKARNSNVFVLTSGTPSRNPVGIFESSAIERLMVELRGRFDVVIFDVPPLLEFPEGYSLARHVDAVLLVLDAERTSLDDARRTVRDLERAGARAAGIVLNRQRDYMPRLLRRFLGPRRTTARA